MCAIWVILADSEVAGVFDTEDQAMNAYDLLMKYGNKNYNFKVIKATRYMS